jgi:hypothetical protein
MDKFSNDILTEITKEFPDWKQLNDNESSCLEIDIPSKSNSKLGGLLIQTTKDKSIWIRNYHPHSGYSVESVSELITIIKGILSDDILWVIESLSPRWCSSPASNLNH